MPASPIALPARIGKYELLEFLGGGMSHVYRAQDTVLQRIVALKILTEENCHNADAKARFLREARLASNIHHDNIIRVYDFGEERDRPYMVMEFLVGRDLRTAIRDNDLGDLRSRLRVARELAGALGHIHQQKIIHRDVKPDNVHIDVTGRVRLMDFGIAKTAEYSLTRPGFTLGTPYYMAPEQVRGAQLTESVDLYSYGILLYEMLLGAKPFAGENVASIFTKILQENLDLNPLVQAGLPRQLVQLIGRLTAKDPPQRPKSFEEVGSELRTIQKALDPASGTTTATSPTLHPSPSGASRVAPPRPLATGIGSPTVTTPPPAPPGPAHLKAWIVAAFIVGAMLALLILDFIFRGR